MSWHCTHNNSYLFINGEEIHKLKANNKYVSFSTQFCLGNISNKFSAVEYREVSLKGYVYDFLVDINVTDTSYSFSTHKYYRLRMM